MYELLNIYSWKSVIHINIRIFMNTLLYSNFHAWAFYVYISVYKFVIVQIYFRVPVKLCWYISLQKYHKNNHLKQTVFTIVKLQKGKCDWSCFETCGMWFQLWSGKSDTENSIFLTFSITSGLHGISFYYFFWKLWYLKVSQHMYFLSCTPAVYQYQVCFFSFVSKLMFIPID